jgi:mannan polymerase II complex MNN10 subunit
MKKVTILLHLLLAGLCLGTNTFAAPKNKIAIVSLFDAGYKEIGQYSDWNKKAYAKKHGYDIYLHHELLDQSRPGAWSKILALQLHLSDYEWIYWSDADSLIMNDDIKLESIIDNNYNLIISQEATKKNLNSGSFLIKNCEWAHQLLKDIYLQEQFIHAYGYWEQAALKHLLRTNKALMEKTKVVHQRVMNSHISEPGGTFQQGDFVIHFYAAKNKKTLMRDFYNLSINLELQKITSLSQDTLNNLLNELITFEQKFAQDTQQYATAITTLIHQFNPKKCCILGSFFGDLSEYILENSAVEKLISIDTYSFNNENTYLPLSKDQLAVLRYKVNKRLDIHDERSVLIPLSSIEAAQNFSAHELDYIFLNKEYNPEALLEDLNIWHPKIISGGIISGKSDPNNLKVLETFSMLKKLIINQDKHKKIWWIVNSI